MAPYRPKKGRKAPPDVGSDSREFLMYAPGRASSPWFCFLLRVPHEITVQPTLTPEEVASRPGSTTPRPRLAERATVFADCAARLRSPSDCATDRLNEVAASLASIAC